MKYCAAKEIDHFIKYLLREGWTFRRGGKHGRLSSPNGKTKLSVPCTPSDKRAFLNFRSEVRRSFLT